MNSRCSLWLAPVIFAVMINGAFAEGAVDQQFAPVAINGYANVGLGNQVDAAQTFTVGVTGMLTAFDLWVTRQANISQPLLFDVRRTHSGNPADADTGPDILASGALPAGSIAVLRPFDPPSIAGELIDLDGGELPAGALLRVDLGNFSIPVHHGEVLAIVLRSDDPNDFRGIGYAWHGKSPGEYEGGALHYRSSVDDIWHTLESFESLSSDQAFRTYVQAIPEPSAAILITVVALVAPFTRRKS